MNTNQLRQNFLDFFAAKQHERVNSSSLVPTNDATLLFTNAGMVQFKDVFLGRDQRTYTRAVSAQRCVRAGGKHNDLDNVGYTARHHTFFEMLGNFSFGDYFKREAIHYAWEFLTQVLKISPQKLWITVYEKDAEAEAIWLNEMKIDPQRFSRCGAASNFWSMGDTGPCGPCTEIFYDHGPEIVGGPPGSPDEDGDRYVEIWNLVFMQYDRDAKGNLTPLPKPSVDTGMGLERISAVMQGVHSNYDIDLFRSIIQAIAKMAQTTDLTHHSLRVIADHIRSTAFLIADGVYPSNEGRGYVLRRIIRRAVRHGHQLGMREPFFYKVLQELVTAMGNAYPELIIQQAVIEKTILREEEQFARTLEQGLKILEQDLTQLSDKTIPGATIFKLYDTYGFPVDLTGDIAREKELQLDLPGFEAEMAKQRKMSQEASHFVMHDNQSIDIKDKTIFTGYDCLTDKSIVIALLKEGQKVNELTEGETGAIILKQTPFYAESGGQIGDQGELSSATSLFKVSNTTKMQDVVLHYGSVKEGKIVVGDQLTATVASQKRQQIRINHSATHLLHAALRKILGEHILQKGSLVDPERLRFDFSHFEAMSKEQLHAVEECVNQQIRANESVVTELMSVQDAQKSGAMALFGEKYGDTVRVLSMGEFSKELCGGTHAERTGDIGVFKIISESGISAGVRRIEAVTGATACAWIDSQQELLLQAAELLKTHPQETVIKLEQTLLHARQLEKEIESLKTKLASSQGEDLLNQVVEVHGIKVLAARLENVELKTLREMMDQLKSKLQTAVIVLASVENDKITLLVGVTNNATDRIQAGKLINELAPQIGGKGGGRPDLAQAGGSDIAALDAMLKTVAEHVKSRLG